MMVKWSSISFLIYIALGLYFYFTTKYICRVKKKNTKKIVPIILFSTVPVFFSVFRLVNGNGVGGTDSQAYVEYFLASTKYDFNIIDTILFKTKSNPLFDFICFSIRSFTSDYHIFFAFIYSFIVIVQYCVCLSIFKNNKYFVVLVYLIYFFLQSFNILRFMFGLSVLEIGFIFLSKKKGFFALFFAFLSSLIHSSLAISIVLILTVLVFKHIKKHKTAILVSFVVIFNIVLLALKPFVLKIIGNSVYEGYMDSSLNIFANLTCILCAFSSLLFFKQFKKKQNFDYSMLFCVFFDFACLPAISYVNFFRIHIIFTIPRLYIWSQEIEICISKTKDTISRAFLLSSFFTIILAYTLFRFSRDWYGAGLMPYCFDF